jgi:hypothetical protein
MPISLAGQLNTTALVVPDAYIQILSPDISTLNGVPTNVLGIVGTAPWGPVGIPTVFGSMSQYAQLFGPVQNRKYDMGTAAAIATQQGANNMLGVRVTDGTDTAAQVAIGGVSGSQASGTVTFTANPVAASTITIGGTVVTFVASGASGNQVNIGGSLSATLTALQGFLAGSADANLSKCTYAANATVLTVTYGQVGIAGNSFTLATNVTGATASGATLAGGAAATAQITIASKYTGSLGNAAQFTLSAGSSSTPSTPTYKAVVSMPGLQPETFDNIGGAGAQLWVNMANAINFGQTAQRGPSQLVRATAGTSVSVPTLGSSTLSGGTDGVTTITAATLVGVDTTPRKGMYALRNAGTGVVMLADADDSTQWTSQVAFAQQEETYVVGTGPFSDTPSTAVANKQAAGIDSAWFKLMLGDWVYWSDAVNGVIRLVSPQAFVAGLLANLAPQNSALNKQVFGVVGTQRSQTGAPYSDAELQVIGQGGLDVITNPIPAGAQFGVRFGRNSSSNALVHGDNYTRLTNYLATTLNSAMGQFVGKLQTQSLRLQAKGSIESFLAAMQAQGQIGTADGSPAFQVTLDDSNNPQPRVALGYMQADVRVTYLSVVEFFIVNLEGGQSVTVTRVGQQS